MDDAGDGVGPVHQIANEALQIIDELPLIVHHRAGRGLLQLDAACDAGHECLCILGKVFENADEITKRLMDLGQRGALEDLFKLFALNCALRNGDAYLKNLGIIYGDVTGPAGLAPAYDLISTLPCLPKDGMTLTLNGSTDWPDPSPLESLLL